MLIRCGKILQSKIQTMSKQLSKAEEILANLSGCTYYHQDIVLAVMKEAMDHAFEAGANWYEDNEDMLKFGRHIKPINKDQFIKDYFGELKL